MIFADMGKLGASARSVIWQTLHVEIAGDRRSGT